MSVQLLALAASLAGKEPLGTHWITGWVVSRASLGTVVKRKFTGPAGNLTLVGQPIVSTLIIEVSQLT
jgi:hypothetical protein